MDPGKLVSVLTIDDSATVIAYLRTLLKERQITTDGCASVAEARSVLAQKKFDLIFLDLVLPDGSGIDLLKEIRAKDKTTPILMLTGRGDVKTVVSAMALGADGFVEKQDLFLDDFMLAVDRAVEHRNGILAREQLEQLKRDMYAMITHDLRNPIGNAGAAADLLLTMTPDDPDHKQVLGIIRTSIDSALDLMEQYLDYEKINAGFLELHKSKSNLADLVTASVNNLGMIARKRKQELTVDAQPLQAAVDPLRMQQVMENLISNAIKYTPEGGKISVRLYETNGSITFEVEDNGFGIPPAELETIFGKFKQLTNGSKLSRGFGLGLMIAHEIVEAHGGTIKAESGGSIAKGSRFTVRLPAV